jgi:Tol biopolymer transport system component
MIKAKIALFAAFAPAIAALALSAACGSDTPASSNPPNQPANPVPAIASISPSSAPATSAALLLTVTGSNFAPAATLQLNGSPRAATVVSSTQMTATLAAADLQVAQTFQVTVSNPAPGGGASNAVNLTVVADKIVFSSNRVLTGADAAAVRTNVWIMDFDGLNQAPLTRLANANSLSPVRSPDGTKIAFLSNRALNGADALNTNSTQNLWVMNADGSAPSALTAYTFAATGGAVASGSIAWAPDGSKIAYTSQAALDGTDAATSAANVWVVKADGTARTPLTGGTTTTASTPAWSPDGTKLVFISNQNIDGTDTNGTTLNIWMVNADGTGLAPLTRTTTHIGTLVLLHLEPRWSPDGRRILFTSNRNLDGTDSISTGVANIWAMNADGTGTTPLTRLSGVNSNAGAWSPDGNQIAFSSNRGLDGSNTTHASSNIWIMDAVGSGATVLTGLANATAFGPQWAPAGRHIRFSSNRALNGADTAISTNNIWQIDPDRSNEVPLTRLTAATVTQ